LTGAPSAYSMAPNF